LKISGEDIARLPISVHGPGYRQMSDCNSIKRRVPMATRVAMLYVGRFSRLQELWYTECKVALN